MVEHGWDGAATPDVVGTFTASAPVTLAVPATPAQRYKMRVEHVETTGDARCRLQWRLGTGTYANIPQANVYTHTQQATYTYTKASTTNGTATITLTGHGLSVGNSVKIAFAPDARTRRIRSAVSRALGSAAVPPAGNTVPATVSP